MGNPGTQIISRKALTDAATPPYMVAVDTAIQQAADEKDRGQRLKKFEHALQLLEGSLGTKKRELHDCLALAECHWELTQPQKAIEFLKEAIQLAPKDARPYALLGRYLMYKGLRDQALNFLDRAIQLDPDDAATRKLRERAALNKKKQYTVVVNANDLQNLGKNKAGGEVAKKKAEATRMIQIGQVAAGTAELERAAHGEGNQFDGALSALFGADVLGADTSILKPDEKKGAGIVIVRAFIAFSFIAVLGLVTGVAFELFGPSGPPGAEDALAALLLKDTTSSLELAASKAEDKGDKALAEAAVAHALLVADHGAGTDRVESVGFMLEGADDEVRTSPQALAARVLIQWHPDAPEDAALDDILKEANEVDEKKNDPWLVMARAERALQQGKDDKAFSLLHRAALGKKGLPRALHRLAREYAQRGQFGPAMSQLERLWQSYPDHTGSLATGALVAALLAHQEDAKKAQKEATDLEKKIAEQLDGDNIEPYDAAAAAITLSALAQARGDEETRGPLMGLAIGSSSSGPVTKSPALLAEVTQLQILDFDPDAAEKLFKKNEDMVDVNVALQRNLTRARVLAGIGDKLRELRVNSSRRAISAEALEVPGGSLVPDFRRFPVPLSPRFDARYFPESAIERALAGGGSAAITRKKLDGVAGIKLAEIALADGAPDDALERLDEVRDGADDSPEFHLTEALVRSAKNDPRRARKAIEEALNIAPDEPRILVAAARIQLSTGDAKSALRSIRDLKKEGYTSPSALSVAARAHIAQGDVDKAREAIEEGKKLSGGDPELLAGLIVVEHGAGNLEAAQEAATSLYKSAPEAAQALGQQNAVVAAYVLDAMARRGRKKSAVEELEVLVERASDTLIAQYFLGTWQVSTGDKTAGKSRLEKVARREEGTAAAAAKKALGIGGDDEGGGGANDDKRKKRRRRRRR